MIINDKQLMQLMSLAHDLMAYPALPEHMQEYIGKLLMEITNQQSDKLRETICH